VAEEPAKFLEYARACREMVARMPDAQDKQKLSELAEAWAELARQAANRRRAAPFRISNQRKTSAENLKVSR
jgi:hypothetical protein